MSRTGAKSADRRPTTVYRCWNADGTLLYVGATTNWKTRRRHHRREKAWWPEVADVTFVDFAERLSALRAERDAIVDEAPLHNQRVTNRRTAGTGTIGARIRFLREDIDLSQANFGAQLGFSQETVVRWEIGRTEPSLATIGAIAELTGADRAWIAFGDLPAREVAA